MKARITLYNREGDVQSAGTCLVRSNGITWGEWLWGGEHLDRRPLSLVRRIARNWYDDGGTRDYEGWDERAETAFRIQPVPEEG